jgi:hypothetical protein
MTTSTPWFRPKRVGFGAGLPIAWQGWALLAAWAAVPLACQVLLPAGRAIVVSGLATLVFVWLARRHTQDGWHWRW